MALLPIAGIFYEIITGGSTGSITSWMSGMNTPLDTSLISLMAIGASHCCAIGQRT